MNSMFEPSFCGVGGFIAIPDFKSSRRDFDGAGESIVGLYGYPRSISSLSNSLAHLPIQNEYQNNVACQKGLETRREFG